MGDTIKLTLPLTEAKVRTLSAGDFVTLDGEIVITAGLPTHHLIIEHIDAGKALPIDITGGTFFHLGSYSRDRDGAFEVLYMNPTTSTRFNPLMPRIIRHFDLRAVGGKGGLDRQCAETMKEVGCVYLSFLGGGSPLLSDAIKEVVGGVAGSRRALSAGQAAGRGPGTARGCNRQQGQQPVRPIAGIGTGSPRHDPA